MFKLHKFSVLLITLVLASPLQASAAEWIIIESNNDIIFEVDISSVKEINKNIFKIWTKQSYPTVQSEKDFSPPIDYDVSKILTAIDCNTNKKAWLMSVYTLDGAVKFSSEASDVKNLKYSEIVPDSYGETYANMVCVLSTKNSVEASKRKTKK